MHALKLVFIASTGAKLWKTTSDGANHNAILTQDGNGNIVAGVQVGSGCDAHVSQVGGGNVAAFVQRCSD